MTWWLLPCDRRHQRAELRADERESRLVSHGVLGARRLLELPVDGVAVERGRPRLAVLQFRGRPAVSGRSTDVTCLGRREMHAAAALATRRSERALEIDIARAIARRIRIREIRGQ